MSNDKVVGFVPKQNKSLVRITDVNGTFKDVNVDYFGGLESLEGFIGFWKDNEDQPFFVINSSRIISVEVLDDNS